MNRLTKTAVASSNAQQVNPVRIVQKPKKETTEFDNGVVNENKIVEIAEKRNGINLTLVPAREQRVAQKIKTAADETIITKDEAKEKEPEQDSQSLVQQPDPSFATPRTESEAPTLPQQMSQALLAEDSVNSLAKGQMRKSNFLELLRAEITRTIEPVLATVGQTTKDCPYMNYWLDLYHQKDAMHIEQTVKKYAPDSIGATSAEEYILIVTQRALRAAVIWAKTGRLSGIPPGVPTTLPGQAPTRSRHAVLTKAKNGGAKVSDDLFAIKEQLGEGQPLSSQVRSRMESAFGTSFQHVRSHTDAKAAALSSRLNARAFAIGNHVAFGAREYQPGTIMGDALIAHELAHVNQQQGATTTIEKMETSDAEYNALEQDADHTAISVVSSLWTNETSSLQKGTQNVVSNLKTGLRLQSCCSQPTIPPKAMKNLTVDMIKMRGSSRTPSNDLANANTIFHNASVNFTPGRNETVPDAVSNSWIGDTDLVAQQTCGTLTTEEKAMYDGAAARYKLGSRMKVFYVATMSGTDALAYSIPPYCAIGSAAPYVNHAVITNNALADTMAHEFGHILLNNGLHHGIDNPPDSCNIMWAGTRTGSVIDASQANIIYTNA